MITLQENIDIKEFTTFKVPSICKYFTEITTIDELQEAIDFSRKKKLTIMPLGGGSNILFVKPFNGLVVKINLKGITETFKNEDYVYVSAYAGENWDDFVQSCVSKNYGGLENLSLIPGNVGTSPLQNIGAYGVEIKDCFFSLKALHIESGKVENFTRERCNFGYRESYFKNEGKDKYIILEVTFLLTRRNHMLHMEYGAIQEELIKKNISNPTIQDVREVVMQIRKSKLPDPKVYGNAGSFFKNPVISNEKFERLQTDYPTIPHYQLENHTVKIPAGWLIEQVGWKGRNQKQAAVHNKQALVLINLGNATGNEVYDLSFAIINDVKDKFGIDLTREVNIIS